MDRLTFAAFYHSTLLDMKKWSRVIFVDKTSFSLNSLNNRYSKSREFITVFPGISRDMIAMSQNLCYGRLSCKMPEIQFIFLKEVQ